MKRNIKIVLGLSLTILIFLFFLPYAGKRFENFRNFAELLYYFSQIGLFFVTIYIAKTISLKQLDSDSKKITLEKHEYLMKTILPLSTKILERFFNIYGLNGNSPLYSGNVDFDVDAVPVDAENWNENYAFRFIADKELNSSRLDLLNDLELFSSYFVSGIADEETGFRLSGEMFCKEVKYFYPTIVRGYIRYNYFKFTVELYKIWSKKLDNKKQF